MSEIIRETLRGEEASLEWDLYTQEARDAEVHIRENRIESIRFPILSQGFAVRIIRKKDETTDGEHQCGIGISPGSFAHGEADVRQALRFATEGSKLSTFPAYRLPSEQRYSFPDVKISDQKIEADLEGTAKDLAEKTMSLLGNEKDIRVTFCKIRLTEIDTTLENCNGLRLEKRDTFAYFEAGLSPSAKEDRLAEYWPRVLARRIDDLNLERDLPDWIRFARDAPKATVPSSGEYDMITPSKVLAEMIPPVVTFHASASALKKSMSRWKERGQKVWSNKVTIFDDGLLDYGLSTSPFDDEGTPQQRTLLIRNGEFQNYITDRLYASFVSRNSSGNGIKNTRAQGILCYGDDVTLHHTNIVMQGGDSSLEEMIKETRKGLLMEQFSWMLPDAITGTFGSEIRHAYLVESGEVKGPIKGGVVNGSFFESEGQNGEKERGVLDSLDLVSKQTEIEASSVLPTIRFPNLRVSGK